MFRHVHHDLTYSCAVSPPTTQRMSVDVTSTMPSTSKTSDQQQPPHVNPSAQSASAESHLPQPPPLHPFQRDDSTKSLPSLLSIAALIIPRVRRYNPMITLLPRNYHRENLLPKLQTRYIQPLCLLATVLSFFPPPVISLFPLLDPQPTMHFKHLRLRLQHIPRSTSLNLPI